MYNTAVESVHTTPLAPEADYYFDKKAFLEIAERESREALQRGIQRGIQVGEQRGVHVGEQKGKQEGIQTVTDYLLSNTDKQLRTEIEQLLSNFQFTQRILEKANKSAEYTAPYNEDEEEYDDTDDLEL